MTVSETPSLSTCIWFDGRAEEAARFYASLLPNSSVDHVLHSPMDWPGGRAGDVLTVSFTLLGRPILALNGGPYQTLTPAISFIVELDSQAELDRVWDALLEGGQPMQCGWLTDRYGVSWQVNFTGLARMMQDEDPARIRRVMEAFMPMVKLDKATIEAAYRR